MTETAGDKPFPGFPGFPPAEMLDKMWDMMRLTPFGSAFPGMQPGTAQGFPSPLSAMSDMMTPLMSVEELDKRITDMRAVEQWLKLNLNMLQSAIQALEVQRATLATLRAFGAFAQASMTQPPADEASSSSSTSTSSAWGGAWAGSDTKAPGTSGGSDSKAGAAGEKADPEAQEAQGTASASTPPGFDPSPWWNLLQSQFNQLAAFAMTQPGPDVAGSQTDGGGAAKAGRAGNDNGGGARGKAGGSSGPAAAKARPAHKKAASARKTGKSGGATDK
ncbi:PhaM family polyhydroxyalkanoate granule multifunctional regulatory protein [Trinickia caryophylli]|uniref:Uncharacterized protein n=1 Tax=Trinickia caryophylli TaxID=28094 RepID=A0A1X7ENC6_TRICW|nr:PhaM family polyhydroxyalkanoate granule multifunctional regulatory protein [Trinickia caryophylli]PMS10270.1 transcriptional regulator [Trinickia caryophylli]TRX18740.1 transcriptional regulator [Trinickia caryophylli]WQE10465.1 PhaM family polyhydroxyalkanoate granule multifunctional regulatory protein [Trinickia caryophylli]SMF36957.1 hypothetical protein SAMN06295900_10667 [Trinickia caryophylli]GLU32813.1 hypothetical protein Busp01_26550 [Trinickia caryophylli]